MNFTPKPTGAPLRLGVGVHEGLRRAKGWIG